MPDPLVERARKIQQEQDPLRARAARVQASAPEPDDGEGYRFLDMRTILPHEDTPSPAPAVLQNETLPPVEMERILRRLDSITGWGMVPDEVETTRQQALPPMMMDSQLGQYETVPRDAKVVEAEQSARQEQITQAFKSMYGDKTLADVQQLDDRLDVAEAAQMAESLRDDPRKFPFSIPSKELLANWAKADWGPEAARAFMGTVGKELKRRKDLMADNPATWVASVTRDMTKMMTGGLLDPLSLRGDLNETQKTEADEAMRQSVDESGILGQAANLGAQLTAAGLTLGGAMRGVTRVLLKAGVSEARAARLATMAVLGTHGGTMQGAEALRQGATLGEAGEEFAKGALVGGSAGGIAGRLSGRLNTRLGKAVAGAGEDVVHHLGTGGRLEDLDAAALGGALGGFVEGRGQFERGRDALAGEQRARVADNVFRSQQARLEAQRARQEAVATEPQSPAVSSAARKIARGSEPTPTEVNVAEKALDSVRPARRSGEIDGGMLDAWAEAQRTGKPVDRTTLNMGVNPIKAVGAAAEVEGAIKRWVIDAPLNPANKAVLNAARSVVDFGPPGGSLREQVRAATDVVRSMVPIYRRGQEFWSRMAEMQGERALGVDDARRAMRDFVRNPDTRQPYTSDQQEAITRWFEGEADDAKLVTAAGESTARKARFWRDTITKNQRALREMGWMDEQTLAEWEGRWLPRVFTKVEQLKRDLRGGRPEFPRSGGKRTPKLHRRRSRFDIEDASGEIVASFKTRPEVDAWLSKNQETEVQSRRDRLAEARDLVKRAEELEKPSEQIGTVRVRREGDEGLVEWETMQGGRSKRHSSRFEDPLDAEDFAGELRSRKADRGKTDAERAASAKSFRAEAERIRKNLPKLTKYEVIEPLTREQREALGEIRDPAVLVSRALATQSSTIAVMKLLDRISKNPRWVSETEGAPFTDQIPSSKAYGPLAGKWVAPSVRKQITGMLRETDFFDKSANLADTLLGQWKYGKTVLRPATHGRNIMGNVLFAELEGTSWLDASNLKNLGEAIKLLRSQPGDAGYETLRFLIKERIAGGDFLSTEVLDLADEVMAMRPGRTWREKVDLYLAEKKRNLKAGRVLEVIPGQSDIGKVMTTLYRLEDMLPKMSAFVRRVRAGETPADAAKSVRRYYPQYDEAWTARLMQAKGPGPAIIRQAVMPFMTFTAEALRILRVHAAENPVKLAAIIYGLQAAGQGLAEAAGLSEDDIELINRNAPTHRKIGLSDWIIPSRGPNGELRALDLTYTIPLADEIQTLMGLLDGDVKQVMGSASPQTSVFGPGPMLIAQLLANKNFFKDRPIDTSDGRSAFSAESRASGRQSKMRFIMETLLPPVFPGGRDIRVIKETLSGIPVDRAGRVRRNKVLVALDLLLGIKVNEFDPERDLEFNAQKAESLAQKKISRVSSVLRDRSMTAEERRAEIAAIKAELVQIQNFAVWIAGGPEERYRDYASLPLTIRQKVARAEQASPDDRRRRRRSILAGE